MNASITSQLHNYKTALMRFRGVYLEAQSSISRRSRRQLNIAEFAILHERGGRRIPLWIRSIDGVAANAKYSMDELSEYQIRDQFELVLQAISYYEIVPKTKRSILATYVAGHISTTAQGLADFAGISLSTAHNWLRECVEIKILELFQTRHEIFYVNPDLIELALSGKVTKRGGFKLQLYADLNELRNRSDWLSESAIASFYGSV